jgi:antitoxin component of MazEF toxin-antitoxin module
MLAVTLHASYIQNINIRTLTIGQFRFRSRNGATASASGFPRDVAARAGLTEGARVDIEAADDGRIIITRSRRRFTLDELLAGMIPEREHRLEDDDPKGEEII